MSGHSHWSTIKRMKAANDAKKSKIFSKMSRLISVAAREGGGDPDMNPSLRLAVEKAKEASMPKDNIEKAINKGLGIGGEGVTYEEIVYEGFGPEGVAFLLKCLTDNRNRTVAEIRNIFGRHGGSLGTSGCTSYIFGSDPENPSFEIEVLEDVAKKVENLCEAFDDNDDVQEIYSNYTIKGE